MADPLNTTAIWNGIAVDADNRAAWLAEGQTRQTFSRRDVERQKKSPLV